MRGRTSRAPSVVFGDYIPSNEGDALSAAEGYVTASADAGRSCNAGGKKFSSTLEALCGWGENFSLIRPPSDFAFFERRPTAYGDEHEAWFDEASGLWFKATYENRFGLAWGRSGSATVREYLTRQILQNKYFGDDIRLVALVNSHAKLRILISQPHVPGEAAEYDEIQDWFRFLEFERLDCDGRIAWYLDAENLLVADAHEGNVIKANTPGGESVLLPIDVNLVQPNGDLRDAILALMPNGQDSG